MPKNFYTLLILPKKHSSAKKISLSGSLVRGVSIFMMGVILFVMYFSYDYIHIRREHAELMRLKQQTVEQRHQIEGLAERVDHFASRMEELRQFDKKIRIMADLEKGHDRRQPLGIGGPAGVENRLRAQLDADDKTLIEGIGRQMARLTDEASSREQSFQDLLAFLKERKSILASTPSIWPVMGWVTSEFGWRSSPFGSEREFHKGLDIATRMGRPVQATADGVVAEVAYQSDLGHMVQVDHGHGFMTLYAHLAKATVRPGATIRKGDRIGMVGNTGRSTGSHLHYSVMIHGVSVNPRKYIH
jgi:murein DD-endopeptidase MepM/ murein hydrolase activator NlpD